MKGAILTGAGLLLGNSLRSCPSATDSVAQGVTPSPRAYLPLVMKQPTPTPTSTSTPTATPTPTSTPTATPTTEPGPTSVPGTPKVVHVHNASATNWTGSGWYGNAVNQTVVNTMTQQGLQELTGKSSWDDIWYELFKRVNSAGYQPGQGIAIKVNFNNSNEGCGDSDNEIDALSQPVVALIAGLIAAGVRQEDIWIYDATKGGRYIPDRFRNLITDSYYNVRFFGKAACGVTESTFNHVHSSLRVTFDDPDSNLTNRWLPDLLYQATYLINMPILKKHGIAPATLGFKNHFGSLDKIIGGENDDLHSYISPSNSLYEAYYSPLVDIYLNSNIAGKTVLIVGDGLYGASGATQSAAQSWSTFGGDAPNSLFFSTDPVAIDCVMVDFIRREWTWGMDGAHDYLFCAEAAGLGVCEGTRSNPGGDPWQMPYGSGYSKITYRRI